jgi:SAM-dependent methyltransferase
MKSKPGSETYGALTLVYNHLMKIVRYDRWVEYIFLLSKDYLPNNPLILELGGGNCRFANIFNKYYSSIIVTDKSLQMLLGDAKQKLTKVCCDMTALPFKSKFDLIYSTFDSINYLTSKKSLIKLFAGVEKLMTASSLFMFDVSSEQNSLKFTREPVKKGRTKKISYMQKSTYNKKTRIHKNIFEIFMPDGFIVREIHKQKIYQFEDYFKIIDKTNLYVVDCLEAFSFKKGKASSERVQFILKKAK